MLQRTSDLHQFVVVEVELGQAKVLRQAINAAQLKINERKINVIQILNNGRPNQAALTKWSLKIDYMCTAYICSSKTKDHKSIRISPKVSRFSDSTSIYPFIDPKIQLDMHTCTVITYLVVIHPQIF